MRGRFFAIFCSVAAAITVHGGPAVAAEADSEGPRILVTFADPDMKRAVVSGRPGPAYRRRASYAASVAVRKSARRIARDFAIEAVAEWPIRTLSVHCLVYRVSGDSKLDDLLARLRERPEVESAQMLHLFETMGGAGAGAGDPYSGLQHGIATLELQQAHSWSLGDGTHVTIIDTGADIAHPDLKTQIVDRRDFVGGGRQAFVNDAHGTAIAGVIAAASGNGVGIIGVAPATNLSVLKACWYIPGRQPATCDSFTLSQALDYAIEARTDVINLSLGGPSDGLLTRLVREALRRDIVVVAAAPRDRAGFPAEIAGVLVVDSLGGLEHDSTKTLIAPGQEILVPTPNGGFDYASGSSLAAAHVSGIVALLLARRPALTSDRIGTLLDTSRATAAASVNACRALAQLLERAGCRQAAVPHTPMSYTQATGDGPVSIAH